MIRSLQRLAAMMAMGSLLLQAQDPAVDEEAAHKERVAKLARAVASRHVSLGEFCANRGLHAWARDEYCRAISLDPDHEAARKKLGDRRKEDGSGWEIDPAARINVTNEKKKDDDLARIRSDYDKKIAEVGRDSAREWYEAGIAAEKAGVKAGAEAAWKRAIEYDPNHESARKKLGHEKLANGRWTTPAEKKLKEELTGGLAKAPAGAEDKTPSPHAEKLGVAIQRRVSDRFQIDSSHLAQEELGKLVQHAEHAHAMFHQMFDYKQNLFPEKYRILILRDRPEHQKYIDHFYTGKDEADRKFCRDHCSGNSGFPQSECFPAKPDPVINRDYVVHYTVQTLTITASGGNRAKWLLEGMALWFTHRLTFTAHWCCVQLAGTGTGDGKKQYKDPHKWAEIVKGWISERNDPVIDAVIKAPNWAEFDAAETVKAWSIVDFLIAENRDSIPALMKALKAEPGDAGEKAFRDVFGWSLQDLDGKWRTWAKSAY